MNTLGFLVTSAFLALATLEAISFDMLRRRFAARAEPRRRQPIASASPVLEKESGSLECTTWPYPSWLRKGTTLNLRSSGNAHHACLTWISTTATPFGGAATPRPSSFASPRPA